MTKDNGAGPAAEAVEGEVRGRAIFDLDKGYWSRVKLATRSEFSLLGLDPNSDAALVTAAVEVVLERTPGAPDGVGVPNRTIIDGKYTIPLTRGTLTSTDPMDPLSTGRPGPGQKKMPVSRKKEVTIAMVAGKTYDIRLDSDDFDSYLRLFNPKGVQIAFDDDSGGNLDARIVFTCQQSGTYRIALSSFDGRLGRYRFSVRED